MADVRSSTIQTAVLRPLSEPNQGVMQCPNAPECWFRVAVSLGEVEQHSAYQHSLIDNAAELRSLARRYLDSGVPIEVVLISSKELNGSNDLRAERLIELVEVSDKDGCVIGHVYHVENYGCYISNSIVYNGLQKRRVIYSAANLIFS
jgi:hypothetical protein